MSLSFPRELYDEVLSHLSSDSTALQYAALICRSWTEPSQTFLFASVDLEADYNDQQPESRPSKLLRSLRAAPHLAAYIRTLSIALRSTGDAPIFPDKANTIATILPLLSRITSLSLDADRIDHQMITAMSEMALNAPLSAIDLPYAVFSSFSDFIQVLPQSLCLRSLEIGRLIIKDTTAPPSIEAAPAIHSLTFDRCVTALPRLAAWMFARPITVHEVRLVDCGGQSPTIIAILKAIAPSVVKLDLDLMGGVPPTKIVFPELLSVTYRLDTASITPPRPASEHTAFLTSFEAPKLEEVTLCFHQYHPHLKVAAIDFASLGRIDEHLSDVAKFPSLRQFHVEAWYPSVFTLPGREDFFQLYRLEDHALLTLQELFVLGGARDSLERLISPDVARRLAYTVPLPQLPATVPLIEEIQEDCGVFFGLLPSRFLNMLTRGLWSASICSWLGTTRVTAPMPVSCEDILKHL